MPRPDSKIMTINPTDVAGDTPTDVTPKATRTARTAPTSNVVSLASATPAAEPKARKGKAPAVVLSKAEVKAKIKDLLAAHKLARAPLTDVELGLRDLDKKAAEAKKAHEKAAKEHGKVIASIEKAAGALDAKRQKYATQYAKAKERIDADIAKLSATA